jgi:hypothetical protein
MTQPMKNIYPKVLVAMTVFCLTLTANATEFKKNIAFPLGQHSTSVKGNVVRGDRDVYFIKVRSGQVMSIGITALEKNAAFSVYEPGAKGPIPSTSEKKDLSNWSGSLSKTGQYRIVVGGTRGNASYKLRVTVK